MNDMPRVAIYGVQEPLFVVQNLSTEHLSPTLSCQEREQATNMKKYAVVGHCCESSDILTSKLYDAESLEPRKLPEAQI